ncbi:MAG TPA: alpha/beta hydrolase [Rhabdochlamydiaceae bacterium]|jgi:hypothetical protein
MLHLLYILIVAHLCFMLPGVSEETSSDIQHSELRRPQEPKRPYSYSEEEVSFTNAGAGITLAGTLTFPKGQGPFPTVILLHGSAPLDRDSSLLSHKPFLVWADYLTRHGVAVLRFDKRSAGKSTGNYGISTIQDFANDAIAAVEYLKTRKEINIKQIGLIGHSEGGMTASIAAAKCNEIAFIVLMAAPAVNAEQIILLQEEAIQRADNVEERLISQSRKFRERVFTLLKEEKNSEVADRKLGDIFEAYLDKLTPSQRKIAEAYYGPKEMQIKFFNSTSFRYWLTYDPILALKQLTIPVLALNGELDLIVSPEQNLKRIAEAFKEANHKDYTVLELPKLNHAFQTCKIGTMAECASIEETASPLALSTLTEWIVQKTTKKK